MVLLNDGTRKVSAPKYDPHATPDEKSVPPKTDRKCDCQAPIRLSERLGAQKNILIAWAHGIEMMH